MPREALLVRTVVELADTLVDEFDIVDLLTLLTDRCVDLLEISAAGVMLAAPDGDLRVVASSNEAMRVVELFELQAHEGPCPDCFRTGEAVIDDDLAMGRHDWPSFASVAMDAGFRSVHAMPMKLRGDIIGALNLFSSQVGSLNEADAVVGRALADLASIAIVQHRVANDAQALSEQLNYALNSRVAIEQAKGVLSERTSVDMGHAFTQMRRYARSHNLRLVDVAHSLIDGRLTSETLGATPSEGS